MAATPSIREGICLAEKWDQSDHGLLQFDSQTGCMVGANPNEAVADSYNRASKLTIDPHAPIADSLLSKTIPQANLDLVAQQNNLRRARQALANLGQLIQNAENTKVTNNGSEPSPSSLQRNRNIRFIKTRISSLEWDIPIYEANIALLQERISFLNQQAQTAPDRAASLEKAQGELQKISDRFQTCNQEELALKTRLEELLEAKIRVGLNQRLLGGFDEMTKSLVAKDYECRKISIELARLEQQTPEGLKGALKFLAERIPTYHKKVQELTTRLQNPVTSASLNRRSFIESEAAHWQSLFSYATGYQQQLMGNAPTAEAHPPIAVASLNPLPIQDQLFGELFGREPISETFLREAREKREEYDSALKEYQSVVDLIVQKVDKKEEKSIDFQAFETAKNNFEQKERELARAYFKIEPDFRNSKSGLMTRFDSPLRLRRELVEPMLKKALAAATQIIEREEEKEKKKEKKNPAYQDYLDVRKSYFLYQKYNATIQKVKSENPNVETSKEYTALMKAFEKNGNNNIFEKCLEITKDKQKLSGQYDQEYLEEGKIAVARKKWMISWMFLAFLKEELETGLRLKRILNETDAKKKIGESFKTLPPEFQFAFTVKELGPETITKLTESEKKDFVKKGVFKYENTSINQPPFLEEFFNSKTESNTNSKKEEKKSCRTGIRADVPICPKETALK